MTYENDLKEVLLQSYIICGWSAAPPPPAAAAAAKFLPHSLCKNAHFLTFEYLTQIFT